MARNETGKSKGKDLEALWALHNASWRDTTQIVSHWQDAALISSDLLQYKADDSWWQVLEKEKITLIIGREYEHLLLAMTVKNGKPHLSYMPMPHPSGIAVDHKKHIVHIASTRNPNQIYDLMPATAATYRLDAKADAIKDKPLVPVRSRFLPGCLYMHDLAMIGSDLYANAVGHNAIVRIDSDSNWQRVWWPKCIEGKNGPVFGQNFIQLNSIAAGQNLKRSFFSASSMEMSKLRPGHKNYPVDKRGVIFSGATREPIAFGLTRPHSARLKDGQIWVDNSGYGEFGFINGAKFEPVTKLEGWTRGLAFCRNIAFVGTSRVIPKFSQYAPGLDVKRSICGVHAIDIKSGEVIGSIQWPFGNQIFAIDWLLSKTTSGFPYVYSKSYNSKLLQYDDRKTLYYAFQASKNGDSK